MSTPGQRPSSSSRDLTLVVESESGTPEEFFAQVGLSIGRAKSNTIHIDHPDVDHIHAKVVKREESFWLRCEGQAKLKVLDPEPGEVGEAELIPGLTIELGGVIIRCRQQVRGMNSLSDDYWAEAAGGERFRVETETFTGDLPKKVGPYEIRKFVARGGMGIVLRGVHKETDLLAAVKLPTPDLNKDNQWLKRFEQEVRTLKSVTHPNLVRLQDAGKEGELHWMAMDWVEGWTVRERLAVYKEAREPMPLQEVQLVLKQVVEGLMALHSNGVVHRDLKPGNLLVGQDGGVKVADFGLAKQVGGEQSTFLTRTGTFAGTMHYMAPEQAEGGDITPATDVYALGVVWYELLTGRRPSGKFKLGKLRPDCPGRWASLIEDCLDDELEERPQLSVIMESLLPAIPKSSQAIKQRKSTPEPEPQAAGGGDTGRPQESDSARPLAHDLSEVAGTIGTIGASGVRWVKETSEAVSKRASTVKERFKKDDDPSGEPGTEEPDEPKGSASPGLPWITYGFVILVLLGPILYRNFFYYTVYDNVLWNRIREQPWEGFSVGGYLQILLESFFSPFFNQDNHPFSDYYGSNIVTIFFFLSGVLLFWWASKTTEKDLGRGGLLKLAWTICVYVFLLRISVLLICPLVPGSGEDGIIYYLLPEGVDALLLPLTGCLWITNRMRPKTSTKVPGWFLVILALQLLAMFVYLTWLFVIFSQVNNFYGMSEFLICYSLKSAGLLALGLAIGYLMNRGKTQEPAADQHARA